MCMAWVHFQTLELNSYLIWAVDLNNLCASQLEDAASPHGMVREMNKLMPTAHFTPCLAVAPLSVSSGVNCISCFSNTKGVLGSTRCDTKQGPVHKGMRAGFYYFIMNPAACDGLLFEEGDSRGEGVNQYQLWIAQNRGLEVYRLMGSNWPFWTV